MDEEPWCPIEVTTAKAWSRIGLDQWSQMAWFVRLANSIDFENLTHGEQITWQEEFVAMYVKGNALATDTQKILAGPLGLAQAEDTAFVLHLPTIAHMQEVKKVVAAHISTLADGQETFIGGFPVTVTISFQKNLAHDHHPNLPRYLIYRGEAAEPTANVYYRALLLRMATLLLTYADNVRRCQLCTKVFLQLRRRAKYCGPKCYTVAGMRDFRAAKKARAKTTPKKYKPMASDKGGSRNGKKTR
jgi:hypothetical protein